MKKRVVEDMYPLSPMQQGMLFHTLLAPDAGMYFEQTTWRIRGEFDVATFERAWNEVVRRYAVLRTGFVWKDVRDPLQVVFRDVQFSIRVQDWSDTVTRDQAGRLAEFLRLDRMEQFDLTRAPLMRWTLLRMEPLDHVFVWSYHHILFDGWSLPILMSSLMEAYKAFRQNRPLRLAPSAPYSNYIAWLLKQDIAKAREYWRKALEGFESPTPVQLPVEIHEPCSREGYVQENCQLSRDVSDGLRALARFGITLNTAIQAGWGLLLGRYGGTEDVVFGSTVSGRPPDLPGAESMVGLFINTLPTRVSWKGAPSIVSWLQGLQALQGESRQYEFLPLTTIQAESVIPSAIPMFETLFVFENYPHTGTGIEEDLGLTLESGAGYSRTNYPLTIAVSPNQEIGITVGYTGERFGQRSVIKMVEHLETVLAQMSANPAGSLADICLSSPEESRKVIVDWNDTSREWVEGANVATCIARHAKQEPDSIAIISESGSMTYGELEAQSNQLARFLRGMGVQPESVVGIWMDHRPLAIVAILGVLKAGGAYLSLEPSMPEERLLYVLRDAGASLLLTEESSLCMVADKAITLLSLDANWGQISHESTSPLHVPIDPENIAYIVYTSGSTGVPKGVAVPHRALANHARHTSQGWGLSSSDRVMQFLAFGFDACGEEIYPTLIAGATLILHKRPGLLSVRELLEYTGIRGVTILHLPVGYWHQMVCDISDQHVHVPLTVRILVVGGESPSREKTRQWVSMTGGGLTFMNAYGPSETTITATVYTLSQQESVEVGASWPIPIGRPIANVRIYLLDDRLHPVPVGVAGTIFIAGAGVARGYVHLPDKTAEHFIPDPFSKTAGARMYCTGDVGRILGDGNIEFVGRQDHQVKVRGYRIELDEIEARLREHPHVQGSVVVVHANGVGEKSLTAYVVPKPGTTPSADDLAESLRGFLPGYMIPSEYHFLDSFPVTATGKIDRKALPLPGEGESHNQHQPQGAWKPTEELLAGIWSDLLGTVVSNPQENFFHLGGHSLVAGRLVSRIRDVFGVELPLQSVFEHPVLLDLAVVVDAARKGETFVSVPAIAPVSRASDIPLSFAQQRLWFIEQLHPGNASYNIPAAYRLQGSLKTEILEQSLGEIIRRHEVLRTVFGEKDGTPVQAFLPDIAFTLPSVDLSAYTQTEQERIFQEHMTAEASRPFDLRRGPLFRLSLICLSPEDHILITTFHHIIADGWSMAVMMREMTELYAAFADGRPSPLQELPVQYADYAAWQRSWLQGEELARQLAYWKECLAGIPPVHEIPLDHPRPVVWSSRGGSLGMSLSRDLSKRITAMSRNEGVTPFMVLLAAFQEFLHRYSGQSDIVVGSPIAGRRHTEVEGLIGFFVNTLVFRTKFDPNDTFRSLLRKVRETALLAYAHQDIPFEKLVEELHPVRDLSHAPIVQIMFVLQNLPGGGGRLPDVTVTRLDGTPTSVNYDLTLLMQEGPDGYMAEFEYSTELFQAESIQRMLGHFVSLLEKLLENPGKPIINQSLLSIEEQRQQLLLWNETHAPFPAHLCVHEVFEALTQQQPDVPAVSFSIVHDEGVETTQLSYCELNARANQLAHHLRRNGVGPEDLVGICMERSLEMVVAIMGVLKAGGAFVPLDPSYPRDRLAYMIEDSRLAVLLTGAGIVDRVPPGATRTICIDADWAGINLEPTTDLPCVTAPESLAYVIYTSGSTGKPKGGMLHHRGLCNLAMVHKRSFHIDQDRRVLQFSSLSFDASVWETVMALLNGGTLCLTSRDTIANIPDLLRLMKSQRITTVTLPPSVLAVFPEEHLPDLQTLITAGEKCPGELVDRWSSGREFFNAYGPTETTVCASMHKCAGVYPQGPPIGRPIANVELYILDAHMQPVPIGVPGELHIGGVGVGRGYLGRPEITAERFVPDPYSTERGARLYKSGDRCRYTPAGEVEFLGRIDFQVKVRGFRIELGEIESVLAELPGVIDTVVAAREDILDEKRLVAYLVMEKDRDHDPNLVRSHLRKRLPEYMVPSGIVFLDEMPLTPNKKVDRNALPPPDALADDSHRVYVAPRNEVETVLTQVAAGLLHLDQVGVTENFFDLGGHSLMATQFISRVKSSFKIEIPLRILFERPTIAEFAVEVECLLRRDEAEPIPTVTAIKRDTVRMTRSDLLRESNPKNKA